MRFVSPVAALAALSLLAGPTQALDGISATVRGTVQYDLVAAAEGSLPPGARMATGGNFRRIRIGVSGAIGENWSYEFTPRLEASSIHFISVGNAFVQYEGDNRLGVKLGAFAPPTNFEDGTASPETLFLERAQPADLNRSIAGSPGRLAATVFRYDADYYAALSWTGGTINDVPDRQQAIVARAAWRPWANGPSGVAVGMNVSHLYAPARTGATHDVRLRVRPELNTQVVDLRLIDTGNLDSNSLTTFGLEAAGNLENFHAQGGWFGFAVDRVTPAIASPLFTGWYLQGGWVLTGEMRQWRSNRGGYSMPRPARPLDGGGFGAIELAVRYSRTGLDEAAGLPGTVMAPGAVRGGQQDIATLGLNWYPFGNVRLMLNYSHVTVDRLNGAGGDISAKLNLVSLRTQISF